MLGIFGLLFGAATIVKDEFVEMDIDQRAREFAYKNGRFYWTNTKGRHFTVEDNTPVYIGIKNGDRCVIRLKDDVILKNFTAEVRAEEEKEKKKREEERIRLINEISAERNKECKQRAIEKGNDIYMYSLTGEELEKYTTLSDSWMLPWTLWKDINTGELFAGTVISKRKNDRIPNYFTPVVLGDTTEDGKIRLTAPDRYFDMRNNCYERIFDTEKLGYRYKRIKNNLKGIILDN